MALSEPGGGGWIMFAVLLLVGLTGFSVNTQLAGHELLWGGRWRPRRLDLRDVAAVLEGPTVSYRGYKVAGIVAELSSGRMVPISTSTHLGKGRRRTWMAAIEERRQRSTNAP
jgi:hypothetical protein